MSDFFGVSQGKFAALNVAAAAVIKAAPGRVQRVQVLVVGSAAGAVYDGAATTGNTIANQVGVIPNVAGNYLIDMPVINGIVVVPGAGQTLAISYD